MSKKLIVGGLLLMTFAAAPSFAAPAKAKPKGDEAKVQKLTAGGPQLQYEQFRKSVEVKVAEKRKEQIAGLQRLLDLGPKENEIPDIKFRLAELFYEESRFYFFRAQEADDRAIKSSSAAEKSDAESEKKAKNKESKVWVRRAMDIYKEIRDKYPKYERMPEVLFALGQSFWSEGNYQGAIEVYAELIRSYKDSPLVSEAWIAFGEYYFNEGDVHKALQSYEHAAADKRSRVYGFALYKQGWCYYNLADWKKALSKFKATVFYSQMSEQLAGENKIALGREATKDYVRAYSHVGDPARAKYEFADLIGKEACDDAQCLALLEQLGGLWYDEGYFDESASIYSQLIKIKPENSRNPYFQGRIVDLVARGPDKNKTIAETRRLVEVYEATKAYVEKMTGDPKAIEKAKTDVAEAAAEAEQTIRKLSQTWNQEAKKTRQPKTYEFAKAMYQDYLKLFATSKYAYEMRFQLGDLYYKLELFDDAAREYEATVRADPKGQYVVEAANDNVLSIEEHIKDLRIPRPKTTDKKQIEIHKEKLRLITACDLYVQVVPVDKAEKLVAVKFKAAKIYYDYFHLDEALKRFDEIVGAHQAEKEAEVAANLVIDIFNERQDWKNVYEFAVRYLKMETLIKDRDKLKTDLNKYGEYAKFKLVQILEENVNKSGGDLRQVCQAYQSFYEEFPKSENADKALFNAQVCWDKVGEKKIANRLRKALLKDYKDSPLTVDVAYYVAKAHEEKTNYKTAGELLAAFAHKYPDDKRSRDAMYNAAVFYAGVGDVREANKLREEYLSKYGKAKGGEKEAAAIYYSIAHDLDTAGRLGEAAKRYEEFTKNFPTATQVWDSMHNEAEIRKKLHQNTQSEKIEGVILGSYERQKQKGAELPREAALYASLIAFERIDKDYGDYKRIRIVPPNVSNPKPFQNSLEEKAKSREKMVKSYTSIVTRYQQADSTIAALYRIAEAWDEFVKGVVSVPCPKGLNEEVCSIIKQSLEEKAAPAREAAFSAYKTCVAKSNELNTFTTYSTKCVKALEQLAPDQYPPIIERSSNYKEPERVDSVRSNPLMMKSNGYVVKENGDKPSEPTLARGKDQKKKSSKDEPEDLE